MMMRTWLAAVLAALSLAAPVRALGLRLAGWAGRNPGGVALFTVALLALGSKGKINHHNGIFFHDTDKQNHTNQGNVDRDVNG